MAMSSSQVRVIDPVLTSVVQGYRGVGHIGHHLFPPVPVRLSGGQVLEFGRESFKLYRARRAPGGDTKRIEFGYLGKPFALIQDSLEGQVPREHMRDASRTPGINLGTRAVNNVMASIMLGVEYERSQLATDAANYDADHRVTLAGADKWTDDTSTPVAHIDAGKEAIRSSVGIYPNTLVLSAQAFNVLKEHPKVLERFKYTSSDSITPKMIAALWDLEKVVVGKAVAFDDSGNSIDMWGNNAVLAYVPAVPSGMEQPSYGYTYVMQGHPLVERSYYENRSKSWVYPVTYERLSVLTGILSGYLIQDPA